MNFIKRFTYGLTVVAVSIGTTFSAFAMNEDDYSNDSLNNVFAITTEVDGESIQIDLSDINTELVSDMSKGPNKPSADHSWTDGNMNFQGNTTVNSSLYTGKRFTGLTEGKIALNYYSVYDRNNVDVSNVVMEIYEVGTLLDSKIYTSSKYTGRGSQSFTLTNYNPEKKYYIKFTGIFDITGNVQKTK